MKGIYVWHEIVFGIIPKNDLYLSLCFQIHLSCLLLLLLLLWCKPFISNHIHCFIYKRSVIAYRNFYFTLSKVVRINDSLICSLKSMHINIASIRNPYKMCHSLCIVWKTMHNCFSWDNFFLCLYKCLYKPQIMISVTVN